MFACDGFVVSPNILVNGYDLISAVVLFCKLSYRELFICIYICGKKILHFVELPTWLSKLWCTLMLFFKWSRCCIKYKKTVKTETVWTWSFCWCSVKTLQYLILNASLVSAGGTSLYVYSRCCTAHNYILCWKVCWVVINENGNLAELILQGLFQIRGGELDPLSIQIFRLLNIRSCTWSEKTWELQGCTVNVDFLKVNICRAVL